MPTRKAVGKPDFASETLHVYGDSSGDKELLALADVPHYKPFNNK